MFECDIQLIIKQYTRSITTISRYDYPLKWPSITAQITNALTSGNERGIMTGLLSLFALTKKYEYEMDEDREPLFGIMESMFPLLGNIIETYMTQNENLMGLALLHMVCKVFYVANQLYICPMLKNEGALGPWMQFFKYVLDCPPPENLSNFVEEMDEIYARDKSI